MDFQNTFFVPQMPVSVLIGHPRARSANADSNRPQNSSVLPRRLYSLWPAQDLTEFWKEAIST
jgi:hypothetical protein